ncbi:telomere repeat-binding protein 5-like isoform X2 [Rhododendron vialii]|uniref:telomere repeat-binding protein 5-like isoform X2 n=1 Tax=Rhododendron vialii TaxID=182163 RepID=UPI00265F9221|nr:telomere repeat-binding protein 5-like isoform X2 [Rhododendron vialii]
MVLQKRLYYGFDGYQVPPIPRATRSDRRRCSFRKKVDDNQMCAFDLLATVAGKLLLEEERSPSSSDRLTEKELSPTLQVSMKKEQQNEDKILRVEPCGGLESMITSDCSVNVAKSKIQVGSFENKVELASSGYQEFFDCTVVDKFKKQMNIELQDTGNISNIAKADICSLDNLTLRDRKNPALVSVESSMTMPLGTDHFSCGSFPAIREDVNLVIRDDDENSSGCTHPSSTTTKSFRAPSCVGNRRLRNGFASKYWKVTPKLKREEKHFNADSEVKPVYHHRKFCYKYQRSQRDYPIKKRKLYYDHSSVPNPDRGISCKGITSFPGKKFSCDASASSATMCGASGKPVCLPGQYRTFQSEDSHVKLRIKSFKVPELFIEIPESATVGSLKRTVMEAVTKILGGGLRVGVLLQGKKLRDDNKTLLQTGISDDNKLDALSFSLEPSGSLAPPPLHHEDSLFPLTCDSPQPLTRYSPTPIAILDPPSLNLGSIVESDHDSAPSPPDMSIDKNLTDSRALVVVPAMNAGASAVVPARKSKRSEAAQRRIRRPFSVSEVEALVQAVEKLGTGRWRDVKLRAFDNAKHRTYVDLKDKWKTLVHTARISPQQRRGEPVPQELLDRVLNAHAHWAKQQAKPETCRFL